MRRLEFPSTPNEGGNRPACVGFRSGVHGCQAACAFTPSPILPTRLPPAPRPSVWLGEYAENFARSKGIPFSRMRNVRLVAACPQTFSKKVTSETDTEIMAPGIAAPVAHWRSPKRMFHSVIAEGKSAASVIGRIKEHALHLACELSLQRFQRRQVISVDQPVVEDVGVSDPVVRMIGRLWILQKNLRSRGRLSFPITGE